MNLLVHSYHVPYVGQPNEASLEIRPKAIEHGRNFDCFRASESVDRRILWSSRTSCDGFRGSEILIRLVDYPVHLTTGK